jgi:hypothetical protein
MLRGLLRFANGSAYNMAKLTPSQGDILAHFQAGQSYALSEIVEHFECSRAILQRALASMPRVQRVGLRYQLVEAPKEPTWHKAPPMNLRRFYGSVIGRVVDARAIKSFMPLIESTKEE